MNITAVTKFKQTELYTALTKLGWTQSDLARRCGVQPTQIGMVINLQERPTETLASKIQIAFGEAGVYIDMLALWPEGFTGFGRGRRPTVHMTKDVDVRQLPAATVATPLMLAQTNDTCRLFNDEAKKLLAPREYDMFRRRVFDGQTYACIGKKHNTSVERTRQIVSRAAHRLIPRYPHNIRLKRTPIAEEMEIMSPKYKEAARG